MRRIILASTLVLAGCATRPQEQPAPPAQPVQVAPPQRQVTRLTGFTAQDLVGHFGRPALQVREGKSLKLQFRGRYCVLDAYLYPGQNGGLRVTYVDTRTLSGADIDQATCISALEYPS
jgi:nitrous oxide reductase accessory protein NosL